ncbi:MAG TPA: PQQ-binding-like beta-propeller repeat protein [Calditrichia bacterium]|nr:PQQ-binding-like beta-propeller repeat protein [Calditrichota bacterium]HQV32068.1 PQQ-binding-like beta-propeller repeat protein [Calditrichia bacterium]
MASQNKNPADGGRRTIRLWPGLAVAILVLLIGAVAPQVSADGMMISLFAGLIGGVLIFIWWLFFSRVSWVERLSGMAFIVLTVVVLRFFQDKSIATGMMGLMYYFFSLPVAALTLVAWSVLTRKWDAAARRLAFVVAMLLAFGVWTLLRVNGIAANGETDFAWRWSETAEEQLLANETVETEAVAEVDSTVESVWPGFRGPRRNGILTGVTIDTDWKAAPPSEIWRQAVGPGWSSFAVMGDVFYTQEQRGEQEMVSCYRLQTGEPVWLHSENTRFWESNAGAGPRSTPTLHQGRVYAFGATGILNCMNAATGEAIWSRETVPDSRVEIPTWGFSSSPLIVEDMVVVAAAGRLLAYDRDSGDLRWLGPEGGYGYSSPHYFAAGGDGQIVLMRGPMATSVSPADGHILWEHALPKGGNIVQPAVLAGGELLLSDGETTGMRRIFVKKTAGEWTTEERWTSNGLKPYFNDFVVHQGYAYGFDGSILSCIDLEEGKRQWKGGRYGNGQMLLLADQNVLLILSEKGEVALVNALPDKFTELARIPAIHGKTWNHPVVAGDVLLVRNSEEMAAFRLTRRGQSLSE